MRILGSSFDVDTHAAPAAAGLLVVRVGGEIDLAGAAEIEHVLGERLQRAAGYAVDLGPLEFVDLAGIRAIVRGTDALRRAGRPVCHVVPASRPVARVAFLAGVPGAPHRVETLGGALSRLAALLAGGQVGRQ